MSNELRALALLLCAFTIPSRASQVTAEPFDGVFAGGNVTLRLDQTDSVVRGTLHVAGTECPVEGAVERGRFVGHFAFEGSRFAVRASLDGEALVLESEGSMRRLAREPRPGPENPLRVVEAAAGGRAREIEQRFPERCLIERGVEIRHPRGWKRKRIGGLPALVPNDAVEIPLLGPSEYYAVVTSPWKISSDLRTEEALELLAAHVLQRVPFLRRTGRPRFVGAGGEARVEMSFAADARGILSLQANAYAALRGGRLVLMIALGEKHAIERRAAEASLMFSTLGAFPPPQGPVDAPSGGSDGDAGGDDGREPHGTREDGLGIDEGDDPDLEDDGSEDEDEEEPDR